MNEHNDTLKKELLELIEERATNHKKIYSCIDRLGRCVVFNTESVYFFFRSEGYRNYVRSCDHLFLDGAALQLYLRLNGIIVERFHGPDLLNRLIDANYFASHPIAFLGSKETIVRVGRVLPISYPLEVGHFQLVELDDQFKILNISLHDYPNQTVFVICLGLPKQEIMANKIASECAVDFGFSILPLGAAIDFLVGEKKRASKFWTMLGLEWLPRLMREPRMIKRILRSVYALFIFHYDKSSGGEIP